MYIMLGVGVIIAVVLVLFGFFVGENCAIKNGLIIRRGEFYHIVPADEYFKLMRLQKKMSVST